jgi:hypothetical protein
MSQPRKSSPVTLLEQEAQQALARELCARLAWLVRLRWIAVVGVCVAVGLAHVQGWVANPRPLWAAAAC